MYELIIPVDAATAPINMEGIPNMKAQKAAAKHEICAVDTVEAHRILWWTA